MLSRILLCIILACSLCAYASAKTNPPVLVSESNSTRAIALESVTLTPEPFALNQPFALVQDQRTRVMIFALNLTLQPGENFSSVTADAEDASHKHYDFTVEYVGRVPEEEWLSTVILRLSDDLTDVGDVLVRLSYNGASSNRVRIGIGHTGGGLSDDTGAIPTPAPPYTIKGRVTENGTGLGGVLVTLSGAQNNQATTDDNGSYSFTVTEAGDYTVTPSKSFYSFTQQSLVFNNLSNHQTGANFNAARQTFTVNGQVTDDNLHGLNGIVVTLTDLTNGITTSATTNGGGSFSFANVVAGYNYTVAPATTNIFTFATQNINPLSSNLMLNIKGARRTYNISGQVVDDNSGALDGIVVALTNITNGTTTTASTSNGGNFSFANMAAGYDYTVTPTTTNIFAFTSQNISALSGNLTLNVKGTRRTYIISGQIIGDAKGIGGVTVNLSGAQTATTTSDSSGNYSIAGVRAGLSYTIAPLQTSFYKFTQQGIGNLSGNQAINFAGALREYTISGRVTDAVGGIGGATLALSGSQTGTVQTDANGNYSFNVLAAGNYTITPSKTHYIFSSQSQSINNLDSSQTVNFNGALRNYAIAGRVTDGSGRGLIGITVTLGGSQAATAITDANGNYSFSATALGNYTVMPSIEQDYYTFAPASQAVNSLSGDQTVGFNATLVPIPNPFNVLEFDGSPESVDYGLFWPWDVNLGHFYWEFWAEPGNGAGATYLLSDGYGGAHALLFGVANYGSSESGHYQLLGNIFDGVLDISHVYYFGGDQGPAIGEWAHMAVGWDGQNIITYYNGVPVGRTLFLGPRRTPGPDGGGGRLLIGGSDHSNFVGRIAEVRGYEGSNPREAAADTRAVESSFIPQTVFSVEGNLLSYFFRPGGRAADLSRGYDGTAHTGQLRGTANGILYPCPGCPLPQYVTDATAPNFATNAPPQPASLSSPSPVPSGARVFDSFGRENSTYLFDARGGLGSTEGGTAGQQVWQTYPEISNHKPFGILNGMAVLLGNSTSVAWIPTGSATGDLSVSVERRAFYWNSGVSTGLSFRVTDEKNYFFAYTSGDLPDNQTLTVGYYLDGHRTDLATGVAMPVGWTTLRVETSITGSISVYADGTLVYSTSSSVQASATGAGLYNNAPDLSLVNRWDNFMVYDSP